MMTSTPKTAHFPRTEAVYRALTHFDEHMNKAVEPTDGILTARVIGEFSAGKTRLLRELFGELIPKNLFPVSSLERQTRLPLEITYGDTPQLSLIDRAQDFHPTQTLEILSYFPQREDLLNHNPLRHRLRLALPETRLILPTGDGYSDDQSPKRLFLIDMPGWNSGDDEIAESQASNILTGYHNLSLVYVVDANRLDGDTNHTRLRDFLEAFADADFVGDSSLVFVVTHCPKADQSRFSQRATERVLKLWVALGNEPEDLALAVMCVEFAELNAAELADFRERFWRHLLAPLARPSTPQHPWIATVRNWPVDWDIRPRLIQAQTIVQTARRLIERACIDGEFLPGMNMHRLIGLDAAQIGDKVRQAWFRQLHSGSFDQLQQTLAVPEAIPRQHPLASWWLHYWQTNLEQTLAPMHRFFKQTDAAMSRLTPETADLQEHLTTHLADAYRQAGQALDSSFTCLVETAQTLVTEAQPEQAVATLLKLSLLEARYADHFEKAKASLSGAD